MHIGNGRRSNRRGCDIDRPDAPQQHAPRRDNAAPRKEGLQKLWSRYVPLIAPNLPQTPPQLNTRPGRRLVEQAVESLINADADEVRITAPPPPTSQQSPDGHQISVITKTTNTNAIKIYERLGFIRTKLLPNGGGGQSWRMMLLLEPLTEGLWDCSSEDNAEACGCGLFSGSTFSLSSCNSGCVHENGQHETSYRTT
jgi:hypothetical protein